VWCIDPGNVSNAVRQTIVGYKHPETGLFTFDSQLRYSCDTGRRFEDGLTSRIILCDVLAVWNDSDFTCECTLIFHLQQPLTASFPHQTDLSTIVGVHNRNRTHNGSKSLLLSLAAVTTVQRHLPFVCCLFICLFISYNADE